MLRGILGFIFAISLLNFALPAFAQESPGIEIGTADSVVATDAHGGAYTFVPVSIEKTGEHQVRASALTDSEKDPFIQVHWEVQINTPQVLTAQVGVLILKEITGNGGDQEKVVGLVADVDPGLMGGMAGAGFQYLHFGQDADISGIALKAVAYRSWFRIGGDLPAPGQGYLGGEAEFTSEIFKFSVGVLSRVSGNKDDHRVIGIFGLGIGI